MLQRCGRHLGIAQQKFPPIGIDADMLVHRRFAGISRIRHERPRKVQRVALQIRDYLDVIGVLHLFLVRHGRHDRRHLKRPILFEQGSQPVDEFRIDQRFIALHIDDQLHVLIGRSNLRQSVCTGRMIRCGHHGLTAVGTHSLANPFIIRSNQHFLHTIGLHSAFIYTADHRLAGNIQQRLTGQPCRGVARRNHT